MEERVAAVLHSEEELGVGVSRRPEQGVRPVIEA